MKEVFEVVTVSPVTEKQWRVRGRALESIGLGERIHGLLDRVYLSTIHTDFVERDIVRLGEVSLESFLIVEISTYGKNIDRLYPVMTGDLLLEGEHGNILEKATYLVTLEE